MTKALQSVVGVILAGGLARRMGGGDKCLLPLGGQTLLQHCIDRAYPQLARLILNVNGDAARLHQPNLPVAADSFPGNLGPLAGIHAGLLWMRENTSHTWLASFACDTPFFPADLVEKLFENTLDAAAPNLVAVTSSQQPQAVFALWHISLLEKIAEQLTRDKVPRLQDWIKQQNSVYVDFSQDGADAFFNINTPEDLLAAESILSRKN